MLIFVFITGAIGGMWVERRLEEPKIQAAEEIIEYNSEGGEFTLYRDPWGGLHYCTPDEGCTETH